MPLGKISPIPPAISCRRDCILSFCDWPDAAADLAASSELPASEKSAAEWGAMKAIILDEWKPRLEEAGSRYKRHCDAIGVTMTIGGLKWEEAVPQAADAIGWTIDKFQMEMNLEMKRRRRETAMKSSSSSHDSRTE